MTEDRISPATTDTAAQAGARHADEIPQPHHVKKASELRLDFDKQGGLLPAIVQDHRTKELLMVGFMNPEAWEKTLRTGLVTFWSRTRQVLWTKGETSGNHPEGGSAVDRLRRGHHPGGGGAQGAHLPHRRQKLLL